MVTMGTPAPAVRCVGQPLRLEQPQQKGKQVGPESRVGERRKRG